MSMIDDAINGGLEPDFGVPRRTLKNLPNPTPNIDDEIVRAVLGKPLPDGYPVPNFVEKIKQLITDARVEAVQELKRRWNDDRKTMDYSPATYQFICDKYIKELKENKR